MEKEKKIIVAVVGVVCVVLLYFFLVGFPSMSGNNSTETAYSLKFETPPVDEEVIEKIESATKKEIYDEDKSENYDKTKYDSLANNFAFLSKMRSKIGSVPQAKKDKTKKLSKAEEFKRQMEEFEKMGKKAVGSAMSSRQTRATGGTPQYANSMNSNYTTASRVSAAPKNVAPRAEPHSGNYFFGAASAKKTPVWQNLVPAETVDQGLFKEGSTIAIRTKKALFFPSTGVKIPKDAVIYGVVSFSGQRVLIDIRTYKQRNRLYPVAITTHDFDGREGIHLKSRTLFNIPANVSEDVYSAAMQTYQQQSNNGFGGQDRVPLKTIAGLSALKEVNKELFVRRRVFIPRKYHIWLTINLEDGKR